MKSVISEQPKYKRVVKTKKVEKKCECDDCKNKLCTCSHCHYHIRMKYEEIEKNKPSILKDIDVKELKSKNRVLLNKLKELGLEEDSPERRQFILEYFEANGIKKEINDKEETVSYEELLSGFMIDRFLKHVSFEENKK